MPAATTPIVRAVRSPRTPSTALESETEAEARTSPVAWDTAAEAELASSDAVDPMAAPVADASSEGFGRENSGGSDGRLGRSGRATDGSKGC